MRQNSSRSAHRRSNTTADRRAALVFPHWDGVTRRSWLSAKVVSRTRNMILLSKLTMSPMRRPGEKREDGTFKTERNSWDFVVDGISVRSIWQDADSFGAVVADSVGVLGWGEPRFEAESVAKLQGNKQPDYPPNRVAMYVCPECGDLGCGAVTVAVNREAEAITWSDFRWEVNWYADH